MKLLPTQTRVATDDALGMAMEIAIIMAVFIGGGFALDRWLGTLPLFMIVGSVLGAIGLFTKHKHRYDMKMDALEAERRNANRTNRAATGSVSTEAAHE
jgi:F0F1-type ATP synthase assembly protein I